MYIDMILFYKYKRSLHSKCKRNYFKLQAVTIVEPSTQENDYYEPETQSGGAVDKNTSHGVCVCALECK